MEPELAQTVMERVRSAVSAFNSGDFEAAFAGVAADVEWHFGPWVFDSPVLRGRDAVIGYYRRLREQAGLWQVEQELLAAAPAILVMHQRARFEGRASGIEGRSESFIVMHIGADGLIVRTRDYETLA